MQRVKTDLDVVKTGYANKSELSRLFCISYETSDRIFNIAKEIDKKELKWLVYDTKVRVTSACQVMGKSYKQLFNQIKSAVQQDKSAK